jgi:hypothetical protein
MAWRERGPSASVADCSMTAVAAWYTPSASRIWRARGSKS